MADRLPGQWQNLTGDQAIQYSCGFCGSLVGSEKVYFSNDARFRVRICPVCNRPTYFEGAQQVPGVAYGQPVNNVPPLIDQLYNEARKATAAGAHTAAVLACRKLLMHIGVQQGAPVDQSFAAYVEYLAAQGYVPPNGRGWVDHIRKKSNEANHDIVLMTPAESSELITFAEMLLKFIYDFPSRVPGVP